MKNSFQIHVLSLCLFPSLAQPEDTKNYEQKQKPNQQEERLTPDHAHAPLVPLRRRGVEKKKYSNAIALYTLSS